MPTPVLVSLVAGEVVEVEKALHCLRPQEVVGVVWFHIEVLGTDANLDVKCTQVIIGPMGTPPASMMKSIYTTFVVPGSL